MKACTKSVHTVHSVTLSNRVGGDAKTNKCETHDMKWHRSFWLQLQTFIWFINKYMLDLYDNKSCLWPIQTSHVSNMSFGSHKGWYCPHCHKNSTWQEKNKPKKKKTQSVRCYESDGIRLRPPPPSDPERDEVAIENGYMDWWMDQSLIKQDNPLAKSSTFPGWTRSPSAI